MFPENDPDCRNRWVDDDRLDRMFAELRQLVSSWGAWPRGERPSVTQVAMVLWVFAVALTVKKGRWPE